MPIDVVNAVIHGFEKEPHVTGMHHVTPFLKPLLDVSLAPVVSLVSGVSNLLGRRENSLSWGIFSDKNISAVTPSQFKSSMASKNNLADPKIFELLVKTIINQIITVASASPLATGSKILFSFYRDEENKERFLVALIKQKGGLTLDQNFVPVGMEQIDMSKVSHAMEVRCEDYLKYHKDLENHIIQGNTDAVFEGEAYLSFISARNSSDAAGYFITAMDCEIFTSSRKSTKVISIAVAKFFGQIEALRPYASQAREAVVQYLKRMCANEQSAVLADVHEEVAKIIPYDLHPQIDNLIAELNGPKYKIPDSFVVDPDGAKKLTTVIIKDEDSNIELKFDNSDFGVSEDSKVQYNKKEKYLKIKLSQKQIDQLNSYV